MRPTRTNFTWFYSPCFRDLAGCRCPRAAVQLVFAGFQLQCVAGSCHPHLGHPDPRRDAEGILRRPRDPFRMLHAEAFFLAGILTRKEF